MNTTQLSHIHAFDPGSAFSNPAIPILLALHGTGGNEHDLPPLLREMHPTAPILSPRGNILEQGMPRFFRRLAPGVFDLADLANRTRELADFIAAARDRYQFAQRPIVAVGYSNGANIAAALLLNHPGTLAGAALLRPMLPYAPKPPASLLGTDVLILSGRHDQMTPPDQPVKLESILRSAGAAVQHTTVPAGHDLSAQDLQTAGRWLHEPSRAWRA